MTTTNTPKHIAGGYALAGVTVSLGVYFGTRIGGDGGAAVTRLLYVVAVLTVLKYTFAWGRLCGFAVKREDGSLSISHALRNLVMAAIVWGALLFLFSPLVMFAFQLAR